MAARLPGLLRCRRGAAALEFGIIAPVLILLLAGLVDLGGAMQQAIRLENAARAGAQYAMSFPQDTAGIRTATTAALGGTTATVQVQPPFCACPGGSSVTPVACTGTPCDGAPAGIYVQVTVTRAYAAIIGIGGFVIPSTLSGQAVARVR
jgi:Flp pilus assembly protein TadG